MRMFNIFCCMNMVHIGTWFTRSMFALSTQECALELDYQCLMRKHFKDFVPVEYIDEQVCCIQDIQA